jgi:hypothetical protein
VRLGDLREKAVTMGKIADILQARGQLEDALALHMERLLLLEQSGYIDEVAHVRFSLARIQLARGGDLPKDVKAILDNLEAAFATSLESGRADAIANIGKLLARVLARDKQRQRALAVLDHAERAFQTLGAQSDIDEILALRQ